MDDQEREKLAARAGCIIVRVAGGRPLAEKIEVRNRGLVALIHEVEKRVRKEIYPGVHDIEEFYRDDPDPKEAT